MGGQGDEVAGADDFAFWQVEGSSLKELFCQGLRGDGRFLIGGEEVGGRFVFELAVKDIFVIYMIPSILSS